MKLSTCIHVWTDYTPYGDVDHYCNREPIGNTKYCEEHLKEHKLKILQDKMCKISNKLSSLKELIFNLYISGNLTDIFIDKITKLQKDYSILQEKYRRLT